MTTVHAHRAAYNTSGDYSWSNRKFHIHGDADPMPVLRCVNCGDEYCGYDETDPPCKAAPFCLTDDSDG